MAAENPLAHIANRINNVSVVKHRKTPLWKGPEHDGVTVSMISKFLVCRERFLALVYHGLRPDRSTDFNHRIEYGHLWHIAEAAFAAGTDWRLAVSEYLETLCQRYPFSQEQIYHWGEVCKTQFPVYCDFWKEHPDEVARKPVYQEDVFDVSCPLPSGRVVRLRGRRDQVDDVGGSLWLKENKTKGDIDEEAIPRQLTFDLQTMTYLTALTLTEKRPIEGVRYNVIRRPLSGGKGSIVRHKPSKSNPSGESASEFYARLRTIIDENREYFFMRWNVIASGQNLQDFQERCLFPILENLCNWWHSQVGKAWTQRDLDYLQFGLHWRHPYGVYNVINEGGSSDLDDYLRTGSTVGLEQVTDLFEELR